ncbi:MAG: efflux RND transporter periplasmic adaptor subunit [Pseudomonadota bacterium]
MAKIDLEKLSINRTPTRQPGRRRLGLWALGLMVLLALSVTLLRMRSATTVDTVTISTAYAYQALTKLNAAGYVVAQRKASIASKATGRLQWLGVVEGSQVKAGDLIARLENEDVQAQLEQSKANVRIAQAELRQTSAALTRARDLARQKFLSAAALDSTQAGFDKAQAGLALALANQHAAQVAVDQTLIRAPFDGVVLTKTANVGDVITPFSAANDSKGAVVTMADMASLEVEADVSEVNLAQIQLGQACEIQLDAFADRRMRGVVSRIVPTVDRAKASVLVKVRLLDHEPGILPEMSAKIAFLEHATPPTQRLPMMAVHQSALTQRNGQAALLLLNGDRVHWVAVSLGAKINDLVGLNVKAGEHGVQVGAKVVAFPSATLQDGDQVRLIQK